MKYLIKCIYRWYYRNFVFRKKNCIISSDVIFNHETKLEGNIKVCGHTLISMTSIGTGSFIAGDCLLVNGSIGRFCSIAPKVECILGTHPLYPFASTHPAFFSLEKQAGFTFVENQLFKERKYTQNGKSFIIGNDVWIGYGVRIMEGVSIGDGSVIAAGALVTKDVPCYEIWGGVPASKVKDRFPELIKDKLNNNIKWWDNNMDWLKDNAYLFQDIEKYLENLSEKLN